MTRTVASGPVEGALDAEGSLPEKVGVDHGSGDVLVPEELLNGADVRAGFEEMGVGRSRDLEARVFGLRPADHLARVLFRALLAAWGSRFFTTRP